MLDNLITNIIYDGRKKDTNPLISFVVPTYNNYSFLSYALKSIVHLNSLDSTEYEIIVISNNMDYDYTSIVEEFKQFNICFYRNGKNYGQVNNINLGAYLAEGKYISFLHDDDYLLPTYLVNVLKIIKKRKVSCLLPDFYVRYEKYYSSLKQSALNILFLFRYFYRKKLQRIDNKDCAYSFRNIYFTPSCGCLFLKSDLERYGYFKDTSGAAWDFFNFRLFSKANSIFRLHKKVGVRRDQTGMSNNEKVKSDFVSDFKLFVEEENIPLLKKYSKVAYTKNNNLLLPFRYRIIASLFFYIHNLDACKNLPVRLYDKGDSL